MADKNNKLNIYLIKKDVPEGQIMKEGTQSKDMGDIGVFYGADSHSAPPSWFRDFFGADAPFPFDLFTASAKGVLLLKMAVKVEEAGAEEERTFAVVFGHGRYMLNEGVTEERFGLKIVLNTMVPDSFRSVDRTSLGSVPKQSREQTSRATAVASFGLDVEQDLVRSVTAKSADKRFGKTFTGRDALTVSAPYGASKIREFLAACVEQYVSTAYKAEYDWIDQILHVRDPALVKVLDDDLVGRLKAGDLNNIWMAAPDVIDWVDIKGFKIGRSKKAELVDDLDVGEFLETLEGENITLDLLASRVIVAVSAKDDSPADQWSAWRCLYAETEKDGRVYVLNDRRWYEIAQTFAQEVIADYANTPEYAGALPDYEHASENAYNKAVAAALPNSCCMDCQTVQHGGGHSKIEFCDILTGDHKLIHVKRNNASAQLSHLFSQGAVAGELFVQDAQFRQKLNDKLPDGHKLADPAVQPNAKDYEIVFGIVVGTDDLDIPFFSKVNLRNTKRRLSGYGYKVSKKKIAIAKAAA